MANITEIPLTDEFENNDGEWEDYDTGPLDHRAQLQQQKHINLRSMIGDATTFYDIGREINMLILTRLSMQELSVRTLGALSTDNDAHAVVRQGERWSSGTTAKDPTRNNWYILSLDCEAAAEMNSTGSLVFR